MISGILIILIVFASVAAIVWPIVLWIKLDEIGWQVHDIQVFLAETSGCCGGECGCLDSGSADNEDESGEAHGKPGSATSH